MDAKLLERITLEPGKRGGKPCIRGMRITVYDILGWLASGMPAEEILPDYPELEALDVTACLAFRSHQLQPPPFALSLSKGISRARHEAFSCLYPAVR